MPLRPLLCLLPLLPGESLPSLLVRLFQKNSYPNLSFLLNLGQEFLSQPDSLICPTQSETLAMLARLTRLNSSDLYNASIHRWADILIAPGIRRFETIMLPKGTEVAILVEPERQQHFWPEDEVQFCPDCIAAQPYHRLKWTLQAVSVCLEHQCLLVRTCAECNARLRISDVVQGQCRHCKFDLTQSPATSIAGDQWGPISQQVIQSWFGCGLDSDQVEGLPRHSPVVLYQVLSFLQRAIGLIEKQWDYLHDPFDNDATVKVFPSQTRSQLTPLKSYLLYATALKALLDWPNGFYQFLDAYRLRDQRDQTDSALDDLGYLYGFRHEEPFQHPAYHFLQQSFEQYLQENFQYNFTLQKMRRLQPKGKLPISLKYVSIAEAARMLQFNWALVKRLVELGYIADYQPPEDQSTRSLNLVLRQDVLDLQRRWSGVMPQADAARLLGLPEETVEALVEVGLIRSGSAMKTGERSNGIENRSLVDLMDRLRQGPVRYLYKQCLETAPLSALTKPGVEIVPIVQDILAGKIRVFWPPTSANLAHLVVVVNDCSF